MKQQLLLGVWTMIVMCPLAMGQAQAPPASSLPVGSASIAEVQGTVLLRSPRGEALSAKPGLTLLPETTIETAKGSAILNLEDGSQVLVKPNSRVVLKAPENSTGLYLQQWLGRIIVKAQKRIGNTPSFRMGTPTAVISVRGTRFEVQVKNKSRTNVSVFEGLVEVRGISGSGPPVLLGPGFSTSVKENRPPEPPLKVELPAGGAHHSGGDAEGRRQDDHLRTPVFISSGQPFNGPAPGEDDGLDQ
jgi:ferric-dicitrate binding protein FerR (iron transport regulator)